MKEVNILGVDINSLTFEEVKEKTEQILKGNRFNFVITPNPEIILLSNKDEHYHDILNKSDLALCDGVGVLFASFVLSQFIPERIAGIDLMIATCELASEYHKTIYLVGSSFDVLQKTKEMLEKRFSHIQIVGFHSAGSVTTDGISDKEEELLKDIQSKKPDIVFVALGAPKQEFFIQRYKKEFSSFVKLCMGVGGAFDMISGKVIRAPKWMQHVGMEWLFRLLQEPKRIKRIFNAVIVFPLFTLWWKIRMHFIYRRNVVGLIINSKQEVLIVQRKGWQDHWQLPQGGIGIFENVTIGARREMKEEIGLIALEELLVKKRFYQYEVDGWHKLNRGYKGQRQNLVVFMFEGKNSEVKVDQFEISDYKWVTQNELVKEVHAVRQEMTKKALTIYQNN